MKRKWTAITGIGAVVLLGIIGAFLPTGDLADARPIDRQAAAVAKEKGYLIVLARVTDRKITMRGTRSETGTYDVAVRKCHPANQIGGRTKVASYIHEGRHLFRKGKSYVMIIAPGGGTGWQSVGHLPL